MTAAKGTAEMRVNKNLPKEIQTALRESKYEKVQSMIYE